MAKKRANGEGSIRQRSDGRWEGKYTAENGKRHSVYGKTQDEVRQKLNKITNEIINGRYIDNTNISLEQWLNMYLETYAKPVVRLSTYIDYETSIRGHINPRIGKNKLNKLRPEIIQKFYNELQINGRIDGKGGLSPKTIRNIHNLLHTALQQAYKNELIPKNFADMVKPPKMIKPEIAILNVSDQEKLQKKCLDERLGIGIILMLYTGIRLGELLGLSWEDIDLDTKQIQINRTLSRLKTFDDSDKKSEIHIGEPKTARSKRAIPLNDFLMPLIKKYRKLQMEEQLKTGYLYTSDGYFMCNELGKPLEPTTFRKTYKRILKEAGVPYIKIHALRHTFATRALENNFDIKVLADLLGHADASTTLNKYAHALPDHKRQSINKLSSLWIEEDKDEGQEENAI